MGLKYLPHDLVRVEDINSLYLSSDHESWITSSLKKAPYVVVIRAESEGFDWISVGIRGKQRNQRMAAMLPKKIIKKHISPYEIVEKKLWKRLDSERIQHKVFQSLIHLVELMSDYKWGPTGSTGFEIVSQHKTVKPQSDLDILLYSKQRLSYDEALTLYNHTKRLLVPVDIQVETNKGAFILKEYVQRRSDKILLKTEKGPILTRNPW